MNSTTLFEQKSKGHVWRLQVVSWNGKTFGNWRKWYADGDDWKPTKEGCTMPIERLPDLMVSLMAFHGLKTPDGL